VLVEAFMVSAAKGSTVTKTYRSHTYLLTYVLTYLLTYSMQHSSS